MATSTVTVHDPSLSAEAEAPSRIRGLPWWLAGLLFIPILAILLWQGFTAAGNPDPTVANTGRGSAISWVMARV